MKLLCTLATGLVALLGFSQSLEVETYTLPNGLTVYLNEDAAANSVYGAVWVKAGGKNDPADATGIAHYLEHMLFKGTTTLGTQDYEKERVHLDSIKSLYDLLGATKDENRRLGIQRAINEQEIKAAEYAIPNEFDRLLKSIGGTGVNASTSNDYTNYYNTFPASQLTKWLELYAHRFQNPVFRLFQSELETVYEEKNRAGDDLERRVGTKFNEYLYGEHPYSTQTVLGSVDHLKNPSLSKMYTYFETYYVANNMALILSGNFDKEAIKPDIARTFGTLRSGMVPEFPEYDNGIFDGRELVKVRITPIKAMFLGYKLVPNTHPDKAALDVVGAMMSNENQTGFIDEMVLNNEVLYAGAYQEYLNDDGSTFIFLVPKILGKGFRKWEEDIRKELEDIAEGRFNDDYFNAIRNGLYRRFQLSLENLRNRTWNIGNAFISGRSWESVLAYPQQIQSLTKEDIQRVAAKYYGDNYLVMQSRTGFPKKVKLQKPPYKPIAARTSAQSEFAKWFEGLPSKLPEPDFIDFEEDIQLLDDYIYYSANPINDVFTLRLNIARGIDEDPSLPILASALNAASTSQYSSAALKKKLGELGASLSVGADYNSFNLEVTGLDAYFDETLELITHTLQEFQPTAKTIEYLANQRKTDSKITKENPSSGGRVLYTYGLFGNDSYEAKRTPYKELKAMTADKVRDQLQGLLGGGFTSIHYVGKLAPSAVKDKLGVDPLYRRNDKDSYAYREANPQNETTIFLLHDKKAIQSYTYYIVNGAPIAPESFYQKEAFNAYYTNSLSGLLFQEVREFRSLAYSTGGRYISPLYEPEKAGRLILFTGSQADKTVDAVEVVLELIQDMPVYEERLESIRNGLLLSSATNKPAFRELPFTVENYLETGYQQDPNIDAYPSYRSMSFDDILQFYREQIAGKPVTITIYGDKSQMDMDKLKQLGRVIEVSWKDIYVE